MATRWRPWFLRKWLGLGLALAAVLAMLWFGWSAWKPDVDAEALQSSPDVTVRDQADVLAFLPASGNRHTALVFVCGSAVDAEAYAILLRPVAAAGYPVFIVRLPYTRAFLHIQQPIVFERVRRVIADHPENSKWVLSGHSLGAALSVLFTHAEPAAVAGLALIASSYPTNIDLSGSQMPVTQIYGTRDGLVAPAKVLAASKRLPPHARRLAIEGGNHSQFGRYAEDAFDGVATISREQQEALTRAEVIRLLAEVDSRR